MTFAELKSYPALLADIKRCKEKIREIDTSYIKSPAYNSSGAAKSSTRQNSTENAYIENISKKEEYEERINSDQAQVERIERYINNISDLRTKMIFEMRVYEQKTWRKIAKAFGGKNSDESVQKIYRRYVEKHPNG